MQSLLLVNIVRRVLHIIREEDLSLTTAAIGGLSLSAGSDEDDDNDKNEHPVLSTTAVAAASRSSLHPPSLQTLLEGVPDATAIHHTSSSGGDSDGKSRSLIPSSLSGLSGQSGLLLLLVVSAHLTDQYLRPQVVPSFACEKNCQCISYNVIRWMHKQIRNPCSQLNKSIRQRPRLRLLLCAQLTGLLPSACLSANRSHAKGFKKAHAFNQRWRPDLQLHIDVRLYT